MHEQYMLQFSTQMATTCNSLTHKQEKKTFHSLTQRQVQYMLQSIAHAVTVHVKI